MISIYTYVQVTVQDGQADRAEALLKVIQKHSTSDDEPGVY